MNPRGKGIVPDASSRNPKITTSDYSGNLQFESTTNADELQLKLVEHLSRHKTIHKLIRCFGCGQPRGPLKMSSVAGICGNCLITVRQKGATARNNFVERSKANIGRFLRRRLHDHF